MKYVNWRQKSRDVPEFFQMQRAACPNWNVRSKTEAVDWRIVIKIPTESLTPNSDFCKSCILVKFQIYGIRAVSSFIPFSLFRLSFFLIYALPFSLFISLLFIFFGGFYTYHIYHEIYLKDKKKIFLIKEPSLIVIKMHNLTPFESLTAYP